MESVNMTDQSSLTKNLNMISSDTIHDKNASQVLKLRRHSNSNMTKRANEELPNFRKINRMPYREANSVQRYNVFQAINSVLPKPQTVVKEKHSSQCLYRAGVPSVANQFKFTQEHSRLNLKTREEHVSRSKLLAENAENSKFDVSIDLS